MLLLSALLSQFAFAQVPEKVLDLSEQQIWGMDFADTYALITTKSGKILRVDTATWKTAEITPKPESFDHGQGGLMDIRFHPDFKNNGWIYWTATVGNKDAQTTRLSRAKLEGTTLKGIETVFEARPIVDSGLHFGSRIAWDAGGALYLTLGERNERERAQKKEEHWGKVIRIAPDGTASIYTSGHRNPQGIARDPVSGEIFVSEHGPRGGDEVNRLVAGANYGWPKLTAGREYWGPKIADTNAGPGFESPLLTWVPSIAPGSLHFFSDRVHPSLRGRAAAGALKDQHLNLIAITRDPKTGKVSGLREEKRLWEGLKQRVRSLAEAPSGDFFFGADSGQLYRVRAK